MKIRKETGSKKACFLFDTIVLEYPKKLP